MPRASSRSARYMAISFSFRSDRTAEFGWSEKKKEPPPRNGSKYLPLQSFGTNCFAAVASHCLPPAHFTTGDPLDSAKMFAARIGLRLELRRMTMADAPI